MSEIQEHPELKEEYQQIILNLDAAVLVTDLRKKLNMSQKEFTQHVNQPISTIEGIEAGDLNVTQNLINDIVKSAKK